MNTSFQAPPVGEEHVPSANGEEIQATVIAPSAPFPPALVLTPLSRRPIRLPDATVQAVIQRPIPVFPVRDTLDQAGAGVKRASIIVVTYNNLVFTRMCLESVLANTECPNYELIVVDNNSTDGTPDYLRELAAQYPHIRAVFNGTNRGFAPANNQGLALAAGDVLVLLNNDTIVSPRWLTQLVKPLDDPAIGLVGPVTNRIGNEAEIATTYQIYGDFMQFSRGYTEAHANELFEIRTPCMFCLAMRRDAFEQIGPLDERFEVGMFEDDDYAMRARGAGYRTACAEDVFVHHFGEASLGSLAPTGEYGKLFHANRCRFEEKWGVTWEPHQKRQSQQYVHLCDRISEIVQRVIPSDATVLVISKGDDELLKMKGRQAWHFPQNQDGSYAGHYPTNSTEAITDLEALRNNGADYLLLPQTAFWWLEYYNGLRQHLETHSRMVIREEDTCAIFDLRLTATHT